MNELKIFENPEFGKIRTVAIDGEPWLVGKDVALVLGYKNPRQALATNVDAEDRGVHSVDTLSGTQEMTIINESGLYSLVLSSKLPKAKQFRRWVTSEVLPSIRKTGGYMTPQTQDQLTALAQSQAALMQALTEQSKAQAGLAEAVKTLASKVEELEDNRPAVVYPKDPPVVSLTGLAKVIINTRRILLDQGSSAEDVWKVTRSILNTCGFSIPEFGVLRLRLEDFF